MIVGGSAAPEQLIRDFDRLGMRLVHAWGMTETVARRHRVARAARAADATRTRSTACARGRACRCRSWSCACVNEHGDVPRDDATSGEVLVRGPWIAARYANGETPDRWTADGWFRTGDVARLDRERLHAAHRSDRRSREERRRVDRHRRARERADGSPRRARGGRRRRGAPEVERAAARRGRAQARATATAEELRAFIAPKFAKFWLPDAFVFVDAIPRTSAGKFKKTELRERFKDHYSSK